MSPPRKPILPRKPRPSGRRTPVNTYYRAEPADQSSSPFRKKSAPKNVRRFFFGFLDIVLILVVLAGLGYSIVISPQPKVILSSPAFHSLGDYQTYANQLFGKLKNRNKITFDEQSITVAIEKKFPEVSSVSTELPLFSERPTLRITVSQASLKISNNGSNYVVDLNGVIVAPTSQLPGAKNLPQIIDQSGFEAKLGQPLLNVGAVDFIKSIIAETKAAKVPLSTLTLPPVAQELDLRSSDQPYFVKFYMGGDALNQAGQYLAARNHFNQANQKPAQYLDVRVPGKIFYK